MAVNIRDANVRDVMRKDVLMSSAYNLEDLYAMCKNNGIRLTQQLKGKANRDKLVKHMVEQYHTFPVDVRNMTLSDAKNEARKHGINGFSKYMLENIDDLKRKIVEARNKAKIMAKCDDNDDDDKEVDVKDTPAVDAVLKNMKSIKLGSSSSSITIDSGNTWSSPSYSSAESANTESANTSEVIELVRGVLYNKVKIEEVSK